MRSDILIARRVHYRARSHHGHKPSRTRGLKHLDGIIVVDAVLRRTFQRRGVVLPRRVINRHVAERNVTRDHIKRTRSNPRILERAYHHIGVRIQRARQLPAQPVKLDARNGRALLYALGQCPLEHAVAHRRVKQRTSPVAGKRHERVHSPCNRSRRIVRRQRRTLDCLEQFLLAVRVKPLDDLSKPVYRRIRIRIAQDMVYIIIFAQVYLSPAAEPRHYRFLLFRSGFAPEQHIRKSLYRLDIRFKTPGRRIAVSLVSALVIAEIAGISYCRLLRFLYGSRSTSSASHGGRFSLR